MAFLLAAIDDGVDPHSWIVGSILVTVFVFGALLLFFALGVPLSRREGRTETTPAPESERAHQPETGTTAIRALRLVDGDERSVDLRPRGCDYLEWVTWRQERAGRGVGPERTADPARRPTPADTVGRDSGAGAGDRTRTGASPTGF